jgi:hypothetical protein
VDLSGRARQDWGVTAFPAAFIVDQNGVIRRSFSGWDDHEVRDLTDLIDKLQKRPDPAGAHAAGKRAAARSRRGQTPPRDRATTADEHARQLGVEVIR